MVSTELARSIRVNALKMVSDAKASHIGSALSIADIVAVLYGHVMHLSPANPDLPTRDRFILSKGHACVAIYAVLSELGYIARDELSTYGMNESWLMNHISHKVPGVEFSTGALGHGLSFGVGKALVAKKEKLPWRTFVLLSDGEMDEGSNWEALMFSAHHRLDNLIAIIDHNKLQSLDTTFSTLNLEPLEEKLNAFGCQVWRVDGHNHEQLAETLMSESNGKPRVVIADTVKGKGVSFMENQVSWHYKSPSPADLEIALGELTENA